MTMLGDGVHAANAIAIAAGALVLVVASAEGPLRPPVCAYVALLVVPPVVNSAALLLPRARLSRVVEAIHVVTLLVLSSMLAGAWIVSPASGLTATPFLLGAAIVNIVGARALRRRPSRDRPARSVSIRTS
jgi:hypothetical protein